MFDRRERAHSRESGLVATTLLHGPVVVGIPRVGQIRGKLDAEVLEGRERRGEPVVGVEMDGLRPPMPAFSHQSANQLATAQRRAVMAFSRATRGQRAVAFMLYFYGCPCAREVYGKILICRNLGLRAETSYAAFGALPRTNYV